MTQSEYVKYLNSSAEKQLEILYKFLLRDPEEFKDFCRAQMRLAKSGKLSEYNNDCIVTLEKSLADIEQRFNILRIVNMLNGDAWTPRHKTFHA